MYRMQLQIVKGLGEIQAKDKQSLGERGRAETLTIGESRNYG